MNVLGRLLAAGCALAAAVAFAAAVTGSGKPITQTRQLKDINGLGLSIPAIVEVGQGSQERLTITADDNVLPLIESVVQGGVLKLRLREGTRLQRATIRVSLQVRTLESISISGSGEVRAPALSGAKLRLDIAGSGDARLGGKAEALDVRLSGSGNVDAAKLAAQRAAVSVSGSGDATVSARESLNVRIAGSGDVRYYGDPKVEKSVAGSGSVRRLGAAPS